MQQIGLHLKVHEIKGSGFKCAVSIMPKSYQENHLEYHFILINPI